MSFDHYILRCCKFFLTDAKFFHDIIQRSGRSIVSCKSFSSFQKKNIVFFNLA